MLPPLSTEVIFGMTILEILFIITMVALILIISKMIILSMRISLKDKVPDHTLKLMERTVFYLFLAIAFLGALSFSGISLGGFLVAGSIVGIVIGLAAQSSIGNLVAGFLLLVESPFRVGDSISWNEHNGIVNNMSLMSTTIRTFEGPQVRIPNEKLFTNAVTNNYNIAARRFEYDIEIRYRDDARKAIDIIRRLADEHPLILKRPDPVVYVKELGDHGMLLRCRFWGPTANWAWWSINMNFLIVIREELLKEGIDIPFPQMTLWTDEPLKAEVPQGSKT